MFKCDTCHIPFVSGTVKSVGHHSVMQTIWWKRISAFKHVKLWSGFTATEEVSGEFGGSTNLDLSGSIEKIIILGFLHYTVMNTSSLWVAGAAATLICSCTSHHPVTDCRKRFPSRWISGAAEYLNIPQCRQIKLLSHFAQLSTSVAVRMQNFLFVLKTKAASSG